MPVHPSPAPGNPAGGPPAPPLDPTSLNHLLAADPSRAARILAAMRPAARAAQAQAHAAVCDVDADQIAAEWRDLIVRAGQGPLARPSRDDQPCAAVYEPEILALADIAEARRWIAALSPTQRVTQAVAQAAWLASFGYPVAVEEIFTAWESAAPRAAA